MASSMRGRASWRITCARLGLDPKWWWGYASSARWRCWLGLLGILKAGGAYLPLDPAYPPERIAFMLDDARAPVLVTHSALRARLPTDCIRIGLPRRRCARDRATAHHRPRHRARSAKSRLCDLHIGIHRNPEGRRGRPPQCGEARKERELCRARPEDVFLHLAPLSFDASTFEIWGALLNGAKLVIYPDDPFRYSQPQARYRESAGQRAVADSCTVPPGGRRGFVGHRRREAALGGRRCSVCFRTCVKSSKRRTAAD